MASPEAPEELKAFAARVYLGKSKIMEQTLELFGTLDTEDYVAYTKDLELMLEGIDAQKRQVVAQMGGQNEAEGMVGGPGGGPVGVAPGVGPDTGVGGPVGPVPGGGGLAPEGPGGPVSGGIA